ncbi:cytochrome b [Algihabitans albus]|uniref:cytochrome b n=1 Tax=Algihabitans albus TaxID=2164067 RepID=UPI001ABCAFCE|nr:cytochrome b [Algihabitans albus]
MQTTQDDAAGYTAGAKIFHWLTALLMTGSFLLAVIMVELPLGPLKIDLYNWHKTVGLTILALAVLRLAWRLRHPPPPMPANMATWERLAAHAAHLGLYLFLFSQPLVGLVMSWASGFPTILFGSFILPNPIGTDQALFDTLSAVHFWSAWVLLTLIALHAGAALRHHFIKKDTVLRRMLPQARR